MHVCVRVYVCVHYTYTYMYVVFACTTCIGLPPSFPSLPNLKRSSFVRELDLSSKVLSIHCYVVPAARSSSVQQGEVCECVSECVCVCVWCVCVCVCA